jgi:hypothetical protein
MKDFSNYGQKQQVGNLVPKKKNIAKKHFYLQQLFENCTLSHTKRKWEVYTDESYIHKHHNSNNDLIWDPNNKQDVIIEKAKHKRHHYGFVAAL